MKGTATQEQRRNWQTQYRVRNKERYVGLAYSVARRWFHAFLEDFPQDIRQECFRIALEGYMFGKPQFLRYAQRELRLTAVRYGFRKSNSKPLSRREIPSAFE